MPTKQAYLDKTFKAVQFLMTSIPILGLEPISVVKKQLFLNLSKAKKGSQDLNHLSQPMSAYLVSQQQLTILRPLPQFQKSFQEADNGLLI